VDDKASDANTASPTVLLIVSWGARADANGTPMRRVSQERRGWVSATLCWTAAPSLSSITCRDMMLGHHFTTPRPSRQTVRPR